MWFPCPPFLRRPRAAHVVRHVVASHHHRIPRWLVFACGAGLGGGLVPIVGWIPSSAPPLVEQAPAPVDVPEPGTLLVFGVALVGLAITRPTQRDLFPPPRPAERERVAPFEFEPGPEAEPRPDWVPPEWLSLPTDDEVTPPSIEEKP